MNGFLFVRVGVDVNKFFKYYFLKYYSKWLYSGCWEYVIVGSMKENNCYNVMLWFGIKLKCDSRRNMIIVIFFYMEYKIVYKVILIN